MNNLYAVLCHDDGHVVAPFASHDVANEWIAEDCDENDSTPDRYEIHPFTPSTDGGFCDE